MNNIHKILILFKKWILIILFLLGKFTLTDCSYFSEKFLSSVNPEQLYKIIKTMNERNLRFLWTDRDENIFLGFSKEVTLSDIIGKDSNILALKDVKMIWF